MAQKFNIIVTIGLNFIFEPRHDKTNKMSVRPAKTQISQGIRPVWSESSLSTWRKLGSLATHWAHSEDSDQTGWMPRLIWVFAGRTLILLVLSCQAHLSCRYTVCLDKKRWRHQMRNISRRVVSRPFRMRESTFRKRHSQNGPMPSWKR